MRVMHFQELRLELVANRQGNDGYQPEFSPYFSRQAGPSSQVPAGTAQTVMTLSFIMMLIPSTICDVSSGSQRGLLGPAYTL